MHRPTYRQAKHMAVNGAARADILKNIAAGEQHLATARARLAAYPLYALVLFPWWLRFAVIMACNRLALRILNYIALSE